MQIFHAWEKWRLADLKRALREVLFAFPFYKKLTRKTGFLARWLFAFIFKDFKDSGKIAEENIKATEK